MIKNIVIILIGILMGGIITVFGFNSAAQYIFSNSGSAVTTESIEAINSLDTSEESLTWLRNLTFKKVAVSSNITGNQSNAILSFNTVQTIFEEIIESNETILFTKLKTLQEKSVKSEWLGIFDIMTQIKTEIEVNQSRVFEIDTELRKLQTINDGTYTTYISESQKFIVSILEYLKALDAIMIGKIPTKESMSLVQEKYTALKNQSLQFTEQANLLSESL